MNKAWTPKDGNEGMNYNDTTQSLINYTNRFEQNRTKGYGLYLKGPDAARYTAEIASQLTTRGLSVICITINDLIAFTKQANMTDPADGLALARREYTQADLLIIDNLGAEQATEWAESQLYAVICDRYEAQKPVIVSTAHDYDSLKKALSSDGGDGTKAKAIISRLREAAYEIEAA